MKDKIEVITRQRKFGTRGGMSKEKSQKFSMRVFKAYN